jgi:hypothetical protein
MDIPPSIFQLHGYGVLEVSQILGIDRSLVLFDYNFVKGWRRTPFKQPTHFFSGFRMDRAGVHGHKVFLSFHFHDGSIGAAFFGFQKTPTDKPREFAEFRV